MCGSYHHTKIEMKYKIYNKIYYQIKTNKDKKLKIFSKSEVVKRIVGLKIIVLLKSNEST